MLFLMIERREEPPVHNATEQDSTAVKMLVGKITLSGPSTRGEKDCYLDT